MKVKKKVTVDLGLPNCVTNTPESRNCVKNVRLFRMWPPNEQYANERSMYYGTECHKWLSSHKFHRRAKQQRTTGVDYTETYHYVTNPVNS